MFVPKIEKDIVYQSQCREGADIDLLEEKRGAHAACSVVARPSRTVVSDEQVIVTLHYLQRAFVAGLQG